MLTSLGEYFFSNCFEWLSLAWQFASLSSRAWRYLSTNVSQGNVATRLRCDGIFNCCFIRNLLLSLLMKEFWNSVCTWQSSGTFCSGHSVVGGLRHASKNPLLQQSTTRKPCCCSELPHDAGHLYRKFVPNSQATQWIGKYGEVVKNHFLYKCITRELMYVTAWYHGTPEPKFTKFGE